MRQQLRRSPHRHAPRLRYELASRPRRHAAVSLCASHPFPPSPSFRLTTLAPLQRDDVKTAFHATRHTAPWFECNGQVGAQFYTPTSVPSVQLLGDLLKQIPILMFAGAEDLICVRSLLLVYIRKMSTEYRSHAESRRYREDDRELGLERRCRLRSASLPHSSHLLQTLTTLRTQNTTDEDWHVNGKKAGTWTTARNLSYVKILDASHMVRLLSRLFTLH